MCSKRSSMLSESEHTHASGLSELGGRRKGGWEGVLEGEGVSSVCLAPTPTPCTSAALHLCSSKPRPSSHRPSAWCVQILLRLRPARALRGRAEGQGGRDDGLAATSAGLAPSGDAASSTDGAQAHLALARPAAAGKPACSPMQGQQTLRGRGPDVRRLGRKGLLRGVHGATGLWVAARALLTLTLTLTRTLTLTLTRTSLTSSWK